MSLKVPIRFRGDRSKTGLEAERVFDILSLNMSIERTQSGLKLVVARALEQFSIGVDEWLVLKIISKYDEEGISVTELANKYDVNVPQMTNMLKKLFKDNLVKQKASLKDRRIKQIKCSRRGARITFEAEQEIQHAMRYWLFDLTDQEIEEFSRILNKITKFDIPQNYNQ